MSLVPGLAWPGDAEARAVHGAMSGGIVALIGPRGTGKTQLAVSVVRDVVFAGGRSAWYIRVADLFDAFRKEFEGGTTGKTMQRAVRAGILCVDEVQEAKWSEFEQREFTRIMDKRYAEMKATVLVANLTPAEFAEVCGATVVSRMYETGTVIVMDGADRRRSTQ